MSNAPVRPCGARRGALDSGQHREGLAVPAAGHNPCGRQPAPLAKSRLFVCAGRRAMAAGNWHGSEIARTGDALVLGPVSWRLESGGTVVARQPGQSLRRGGTPAVGQRRQDGRQLEWEGDILANAAIWGRGPGPRVPYAAARARAARQNRRTDRGSFASAGDSPRAPTANA